MNLFYIPAFKKGKLLAILRLAFNNNKDIRFYICNLQNIDDDSINKLHFNETNNVSLNRCDIANNKDVINSNIKDIVKKRISFVFKELLNLKEEDNVQIDYAILDLMSVEQWQDIFNAFE